MSKLLLFINDIYINCPYSKQKLCFNINIEILNLDGNITRICSWKTENDSMEKGLKNSIRTEKVRVRAKIRDEKQVEMETQDWGDSSADGVFASSKDLNSVPRNNVF